MKDGLARAAAGNPPTDLSARGSSQHGPVTRRRKNVALAIAAVADAMQLGLYPAFLGGALSIPDDLLDALVATLLVITLGWRWRLVMALAMELVPGLALFPSWTFFVATMPAAPRIRPTAARIPSEAPAGARGPTNP
jgi:hypothetical protein